MTGLEGASIPGSDHLREALTNCTDPLQAIEEFQLQNGILLPSLRPALPFVDLHGIRRLEFHQSVMEELREKLVQRIDELATSNEKNKNKILNDLLSKSFPIIKNSALRPVVMAVLKHLPKIKQEYLNAIMDNETLYKEAAVEVKQQIWQDNQALFGDEVSPLLSTYIEEKESVLFLHDKLTPSFFNHTPKQRRQNPVIKKLTQMVGKNVKLYDMVLQFLRTLFLRTRNTHYCTLRAEMLMALHDLEVHEICSVDPCHKFTWCLDACIRERFVDAKRAKELQGFLDSIRRGQEQVLGDLSMVLCDPYAIHTISVSTMKSLQHCANVECVPRMNDELIFLLRLLALGLNAWRMIDSQLFKETKLETSIVTKTMPLIVSLFVDDHYHAMGQKGSDPQSLTEPVPEGIIIVSRDNPIAATIAMYYALQVAKQGNVAATCRILPALAQSDSDIIYQDALLHTLVSHLSMHPDQFAHLDQVGAVFDQFFLPNLSRENVLRHLLRLIWWVHQKIPAARLTALMNTLQPNNQHSTAVHKVFTALSERISSYQPSPTTEPEKLDSPLMSVPAPTPAPF